jgi:hypothetical protein
MERLIRNLDMTGSSPVADGRDMHRASQIAAYFSLSRAVTVVGHRKV